MPNYIRQFGSLTDWINYSENDQPDDDPNQSTRSSINFRFDFTGVQSKAQAYQLLRTGYPEGLQKMKEVLNCVRNLIRLKSPQYEFAECPEGSAPNIEAFLQGMPDDMFFLSPVELEAPPSILSVQFEMCYSAQVTREQSTWAGATVFAAMEALRAQGCAVQPILTHTHNAHHSRHGDNWQAVVTIPNSLDLDTLSFLFTHPSVLRVMVFSMMEHESKEIRYHFGSYQGGGYGFHATLKNPQADVLLWIQSICQLFQDGNPAHNLLTAQTMLQTLVDTKMERFQ